MFADSAKIFIKSGKGGDGHVSFRRELYVPAGGPDGGDGGKGGDIIFQVDEGLNTLMDFRHVRKYVAQSGEEGGKRRCHGANGSDLVIKVPEGTVIKDFESGKVIADMSGENRRKVILKGGKGVKELLYHVNELLKTVDDAPIVFEPEFELEFQDDRSLPYTVEKAENGVYVVEGPRIEKMLGYTNLESEKGFDFFQKFLKNTGILADLEKAGIEEGDTVRMYGLEFDYYK